MNVFEIIELKYPELTNSEKKVADYYLTVRLDVASKTLAEISENTECGEATVVRFCRKLGFDSFNDVKLQISLENAKELVQLDKGYVSSIEENVAQVLHHSVELLDMEELDKAVNIIANAKRLTVVGVGASGISAEAIAMRFIRDGKPCQCIADPHFQAMFASYANEDDVILAFSISGRSKDTYETVQMAKKNGTKVISITNYANSPLGKLSDVVLLSCKRDNPLTSGNLVAQINQMFIGDLLITGYCLLDEKQSLKLRKLTYNAIRNKVVD